ncbi:PAS domain-containing sensor histidine kinase [uncultured Shewanella sp.]|uniref:sensor histidine kinase n=1 Tax=Shewanella atlantica TaxID=271099 RepID=UPI0026059C7A|nr:HAMP domain-containing sensor histidine kinase [uncultured Shewanella sp.]
MSIKRYVFLLFGALILLLAGSQLFISQYFKSELQSELSHSSKTLSQNLVKVLIDNVGDENEFVVEYPSEFDVEQLAEIEEAAVSFAEDIRELEAEINALSLDMEQELISPNPPPKVREVYRREMSEKQAELKEHLKAMAEHGRKMEIAERQNKIAIRKEAAREYRQRLHEAVRDVEIQTDNWLDSGSIAIIEGGKDVTLALNGDFSLSNEGTNTELERFNDSMLLLILVTSLVALILAYLLSHYVSAPLSKLAVGHHKLGEGELGYQLKEEGVKELKQILAGFNAMSQKLSQLSAKEQLMSQQQQLAELGEVTRGIAHSLRNPLHTVGLLSDGVALADTVEERSELILKIQQKISMMDKSIQSLLTLSSNEVDRSGAVPLTAIIQDILLELSINGSKPAISFDCDEAGIVLPGAESELRSILHAVIINAVEATPDEGDVSIELNVTDDEYRVIVTDTGSGIPPEVRERLCQPHVTTKTEGSGMGIYIAERLLKGHYGGDLTFEDNPGGGTIVTISFIRPTDHSTVKET